MTGVERHRPHEADQGIGHAGVFGRAAQRVVAHREGLQGGAQEGRRGRLGIGFQGRERRRRRPLEVEFTSIDQSYNFV